MVEVLFYRTDIVYNGSVKTYWFSTRDVNGQVIPMIFDRREDAIAYCSAEDLTCGFAE
jgi:hypothetical protein